jgi:hypothetical protein
MDEEQALWEVATALGIEFDADPVMCRALAAADLLKRVESIETRTGPLDREWHEGLAAATVPATVKLLTEGRLDTYLRTGDGLEAAVTAVAELAPLPDPKDYVYARVLLDCLHARRHPAG